MTAIGFCNPWAPVEWIAAHGLAPHWLRVRAMAGPSALAVSRGICPYAGAVFDAPLPDDVAALVLTTTCDQMRYLAALFGQRRDVPVFLLNVPSTWQTPAARELYLTELRRLGRFLVQCGGQTPEPEALTQVMTAYQDAREQVCAARANLSARQFAEALAALRGPIDMEAVMRHSSTQDAPPPALPDAGVRLALLGGPLLDSDYSLFELLEQIGGRVVLDATEAGERTLPRAFVAERVAADPVRELAEAYFDAIPDAFQRPNTRLYEWLKRAVVARKVRGILLRRYLWCDLWHAELQRVKQWTALPVLEIDVGPDDVTVPNRIQGRIEAFMETLQ